MNHLGRALALALVGASALAASLLWAPPARAVDRRTEAAAKAALKKAANDYLATDYATAETRLDKAARACGPSRCTPATKAALLRDLGTMQFRNGDLGAAHKTWADALKLQPDVDLNPDYDTADLRKAWEDAKGAAGAGPQPTGDFPHTSPAEQKTNTPLPVYVDSPSGISVARVVVKYRGAAMNDWKRLELKKVGSGWGGLIPCGDVTAGTMRYWVQGFDDGGDPVASSGDPKHPYTVTIREQISAEAPHLPGKPAPQACGGGGGGGGGEDADCPPGLPGCGENEEGGGESKGEAEGETPAAGAGEGESYARWWFGVSGAADFLSLPAGQDVCKLNSSAAPANSANYYCTDPGGSDFPKRNDGGAQNGHLSVQGQAGQASGGIQPGNVRVMLAADYALTPSFLVGARVGYALNGYTGDAAVQAGRAFGPKLHLEARATYLFGDRPLAHTGFAPMAFAGLGVSEFDGHTTTVVTLDNVAGQEPVNVWLTNGPFFIVAGGGVRYQFSPRAAFTAAARLNAVMGGNGFLLTYGPEIGVLYGF